MKLERLRGHSFLPSLLPKQSVVVDLGANCGEFSDAISRRFGWQCYAVEPSPSVFERIPGRDGLRKFNIAIAGQDGPVALHLAENSEESSIVRGTQAGPGTMNVEGLTLESFCSHAGLSRIDLLKVDIEGAEVPLFETIADDRLSQIRQISIEFHDFNRAIHSDDVIRVRRRLRRAGFIDIKMSVFHNGDILFVNRKACRVSFAQMIALKYLVRPLAFARRFLERYVSPRFSRKASST